MSMKIVCHSPKQLALALEMVEKTGVKWWDHCDMRSKLDQIMTMTFEDSEWRDGLCVEIYVNVRRNMAVWSWGEW